MWQGRSEENPSLLAQAPAFAFGTAPVTETDS